MPVRAQVAYEIERSRRKDSIIRRRHFDDAFEGLGGIANDGRFPGEMSGHLREQRRGNRPGLHRLSENHKIGAWEK